MLKKLIYTIGAILAAGQVALIILKLTDIVGGLRWVWVLSPLWAFISAFVLCCIYTVIKSRSASSAGHIGKDDADEEG